MNIRKVGRYEIISELGRGGMATVYLAYDPKFDREIAIKLLPREFLHDPSFKTRFEREAKAIGALEHSAIIPVHDFGEESGQPYLVMRYMTGGSLLDRKKQGPLNTGEISSIFTRIAKALDEAHKMGMIHRDIKPANILLDRHGEAYLSDFGIVKLTQETTAFTGSGIIGTPAYMSPEQVRGDRDIDSRSDIYALGVVLFELLTGERPYDADTPMGLAIKHLTEPVPRITEVKPDLSPSYETLIERVLNKEPEGRYATAGELAIALEDIATKERKAPSIQDSDGSEIIPDDEEIEPEEVDSLEQPEPTKTLPRDTESTATDDIDPRTLAKKKILTPLVGSKRYLIGAGGVVVVVLLAFLIPRVLDVSPPASLSETPPATSSGEIDVPTITESEVAENVIVTRAAQTVEAGIAEDARKTRTAISAISPTPRLEVTSTAEYNAGEIRTNSIDGTEMVFIPSGTFTMGAWPEVGYKVCLDYPSEGMDSDDCKSSWYDRESPPHEIYLSSYWIHKTEVTIAQYQSCVGGGNCVSMDQAGRPSNHPVANVTWKQARDYCQWAGLDLPTEAQWEKAARGPSDRLWPWGNTPSTLVLNSFESGIKGTIAVGSYPLGESYYGLLDMGGNVWEFVYDWFDSGYYQTSKASEDDTRGPISSPQNQRVRRGGGYGGDIGGDFNDARVSARQGVGPSFPSYGVGYRCAGSELP